MSSENPPEIEYLEPAHAEQPTGGGRRWGLVGVATVGVLAVAGVGAWGVTQFFGGGPAPAAAVPANALAYVALDLDPDAGQKIEAYQTLKKFPAIEKEIGSQEDLRRALVEALLEDAPCDNLDFEGDINPWLGDRIAVSVVPGEDEPVPFVVVQVKDQAKAEEGVAALAECGDEDPPGTAAVGDDYLVVAETDDLASQVAQDAEEGSLADDSGYQQWVERAGGEGILTGYLDAEAPKALLDEMGGFGGEMMSESDSGMMAGRAAALSPSDDPSDDPSDLPSDLPTDFPSDLPSDFPSELLTEMPSDFPSEFDDDLGGGMGMFPFFGQGFADLEKALEDFEGAALVVRFDDGTLEVEMAASAGAEIPASDGQDSGMDDLPDTTAAALGFGVGDTAVQDLLDQLGEGIGEEELEQMLAEAEADTGLSLPEDLQTMLGDGVSLAFDSSVDWSTLMVPGTAPDVPVGVRISGDPDEIVPVLEQAISAAGAEDQVTVESGDGVVAVALTEEYAASLAQDGDLGGREGFEAALPDLGDSAGGLFVDFDADEWLTGLIEQESPEDTELRENVEPLDTLGVTGEADGDVLHGVLRLSTD